MRVRRPLAALLAVVPLAVVGCPSLGEIQLGVCGNGVIEPELGEECDTPQEGSAEQADVHGRVSRCAGPGETGACHFVWDASACCPTGSAPGADGRCRFPSGVFAPAAAQTLTRPAERAQAADVDGDQWPDLLLEYDNDDLDLVFFGRGGAPRSTVTLQRDRETRPVLGHLGARQDDRFDACSVARAPGPGAVLLPSAAGARILLGREGPELISKVNAAFDPEEEARAIALPGGACLPPVPLVDVVPPDLDCPGLLTEDRDGLSVYVVLLGLDLPDDPNADELDDPDGAPIRRHVFADTGFDQLVEEAPPTILRLPGWRGCDGVAFTFDRGGRRSVEVVRFCPSESFYTYDGDALPPIVLDDGETPHFVDATGDGEVDLVRGSTETVRVLAGDGTGRFVDEGLSIPTPQVPGASDAPIAVAHLDDDGVVDVINPYAVFVSGGRCDEEGCEHRLAAVQVPDETAVWKQAVVGDFNGDGRPDVAATRHSVTGGDNHAVDLLLSGLSSMYTTLSIATDEPPEKLVTQDFDGDGIHDVAYVVHAAGGCTAGDDEVFVAFGGPQPSAPVRVAELAGVVNVATAPLLFDPDTFDGTGDIGIATSCPDREGPLDHAAAVLLGSTDRRLRSPYPFMNVTDGARALLATLDLEGGADDHPDLLGVAPTRGGAVLGPDDGQILVEELSAWAFRSIADAELPGARDNEGVRLGTHVPTVTHATRAQPGAPRSRLLQRGALVTGALDEDAAPCVPGSEGGPPCAPAEAALFLSSEQVGPDSLDQRGVPRLFVMRGLDVAVETAPADPAACPSFGAEQIVEEREVDVDIGILDRAYALTAKTTEAAVVDADGDGRPDVVGWWRGPATAAPDSPTIGGAAVFWNAGDGFGGRCADALPVPAGEVLVRVHAVAGGALLLVTDRAVRVLRPGPDRRLDGCVAADGASCSVVHEAAEASIRDVAVLDFDQDGLDDLAILLEDGVALIAQRPRDEVEAR